MYLAKLHRQHDMVLRILLEDLKQHAEALRYIHTLDFFEAEKNIKQYGKDLMAQVPEETTKLLMELCSTYSPITDDAESLFALDTKGSCRECYSSLRLRDRSSPSAGHHSPSLRHVSSVRFDCIANAGLQQLTAILEDMSFIEGAAANRAHPAEFIHIFINHPDWLVKVRVYLLELLHPVRWNSLYASSVLPSSSSSSLSSKKTAIPAATLVTFLSSTTRYSKCTCARMIHRI